MTKRNRPIYGIAAIFVIALGLASRKFPAMFPAVLDKYPGDALWALMVFLGWCVLLPGKKTRTVALFALVTSYAVEFSKFYHAPWINSLRATTPGHLVLGTTFSWLNLVAYTIGIATGAVCDKLRFGNRGCAP